MCESITLVYKLCFYINILQQRTVCIPTGDIQQNRSYIVMFSAAGLSRVADFHHVTIRTVQNNKTKFVLLLTYLRQSFSRN